MSRWRWLVAGLAGASLAAAYLLNLARLARIRAWLTARGLAEPRLFWSGFALILLAGTALRMAMTYAIRLPMVMPDSYVYLESALLNPAFPISDARPVVFPYLIAVSFRLFRDPVGLLIVHNVLALVTAAALAVALRRRYGLGATALLALFFILFAEKNLDFEYLLLTEHLTRMLYLLFAAVLLTYWKNDSVFAQILLGFLVVLNILTKSSALILIPVFFLWRAADPRVGLSPKRLAKCSVVFAATVALCLSIYGLAGYRTLGFSPFSSMTGHALYYHVNPLTVIEGGKYPEIKAELRTFFPIYRDKYWSRGQNLGNWAIWGFAETPDVARDFGSRSPAAAVLHYMRRHPEGPPFPQKDRIFRDLSLEAIRAHFDSYVALSLRSLRSLVLDGLSFSYSRRPFDRSPAFRQREEYLKAWFRVGRAEWTAVPLADEEAPGVASTLFAAVEGMAPALKELFLAFVVASPVFWILLWKSETARSDLLRMVGVLVGLVAAYLVLLAFVCPGEPDRYVTNIQDVIVLIPLMLAGGIRLTARPERPLAAI